MHNRIDWCVRGYSHGFYNRGQDSAGLLIYEQSSRNIVAFNSVTHGGDGLFLWAGQSTMDTGQGGVNDNLFYDNDFSHAPTNGIEATFSRNVVLSATASRSTGTASGAATASTRGSRQHVRAQRRGDRHRARPGQPDHREHASTATRRRSGCGRTRRRIRTGVSEAPRHAQPRLRASRATRFTGNTTALKFADDAERARADATRSTRSARSRC